MFTRIENKIILYVQACKIIIRSAGINAHIIIIIEITNYWSGKCLTCRTGSDAPAIPIPTMLIPVPIPVLTMLIPVLMLPSWLIQWILLLPVILTISPPNPRNSVDTRAKLLNVAVFNFRSVMGKKADLLELISNQKPYI